MGTVRIRLHRDKAPVTVENFLRYVGSGFYAGTVFHRVVPKALIQGGGFTPDLTARQTGGSIALESRNGLKNVRGAVTMARQRDPDSATVQFFINVVDNPGYDYPEPDGYGYAVFGEVIEGMAVVDRISAVKTGARGIASLPVTPVVIEEMRLEGP
jgi:peptidyl-prolyl cis-trans isomerase A (cyclophilin A)